MEQRYELIELLGTGGMARVHRARDTVLDRDVAIKRLLPHMAADPDAAARFRSEAQAAAGLNHPGIVTVFDSGEDDQGPFIVMELIEGETLADKLASNGPLAVAEAAAIVGEAAEALDEAHRHGVVHCDIKPSNLMLDSSGRVRLTDFGIARAVDDATRVTKTGEFAGTLSYLAPEIVAGETPTPASDVYSLGAVAYEMITGEPPFAAETVPALLTKITNELPPDLGPLVTPEIASGIASALDKDPSARPETARRLAMAMRAGTTMPLEPGMVTPTTAGLRKNQAATEPTMVLTNPPSDKPPRRQILLPVSLLGVALLAVLLALSAGLGEEVGAFPETSTSTTMITSTSTTATTTSTSTTTTTVPSTTTTALRTPDQILTAIAAVTQKMDPPEFKPKEIRELEKLFDEVAERAERDDRQRLAEELQKALDKVLDLTEGQIKSELVDLVVLLAESYDFSVNGDEIESGD